MKKRIPILKIPFDNITLDETIIYLEQCLKQPRQYQFATPNPEIILKTLEDKKYKHLIQNCAINIPDGIGILWAATFLSKISSKTPLPLRYILGIYLLIKTFIYKRSSCRILKERVTGSDLMIKFFEQAIKKSNPYKIFLLGAKPQIAATIAEKFNNKFPNKNIVGTFSGSPAPESEKEIIDKINSTKPDLLFVAFGAPQQEFWIARNLPQMPSVKVAIGVGGAFDFIAGKVRRAPNWVRKIGLEWLYRLVKEPKRYKRIFNATIKFPLTVIKYGKPLN